MLLFCLQPTTTFSIESTFDDPDYPEFFEYDISTPDSFIFLRPSFNSSNYASYIFNSTIDDIPTSRPWYIREVTFISINYDQLLRNVETVEFFASLNNKNASTSCKINKFYDRDSCNLIIEELVLTYLQPQSHFKLNISVTFRQTTYPWEHMIYGIHLLSLTLKSTERQYIDKPLPLNENNSRFTALIANPSYEFATGGTIFYNVTFYIKKFFYELRFMLIQPFFSLNPKKNLMLNITFTSNYNLIPLKIQLQNYTMVSTVASQKSVNFLFRYTNLLETSFSLGKLDLDIIDLGIHHIDVAGHFFITDKEEKIFPGDLEMNTFLFFNISVIFPIFFLSKLLYKRFFDYW
jgi:hypothetical protein